MDLLLESHVTTKRDGKPFIREGIDSEHQSWLQSWLAGVILPYSP